MNPPSCHSMSHFKIIALGIILLLHTLFLLEDKRMTRRFLYIFFQSSKIIMCSHSWQIASQCSRAKVMFCVKKDFGIWSVAPCFSAVPTLFPEARRPCSSGIDYSVMWRSCGADGVNMFGCRCWTDGKSGSDPCCSCKIPSAQRYKTVVTQIIVSCLCLWCETL